MPAFAPGARIADRYRLQALLGSGGMGSVFEAQDERLQRTVALKLLTAVSASDAVGLARFEREVRAPGLIQHPAVVAVLDSGMEQGTPFLVMERLLGCDLHDAIATRGALSVQAAARLTCEIGRVLHVAHGAGIVHRDLKPRNVFLLDQTFERIKVLDFGIAKWLGDQLDLTGPSQVFGTPAYMAPEQLASSKNADPRSDVYALGALLFTMLSARSPFVAKSQVELFMMVWSDPVPELSTLRSDVPATLSAIVTRALAKAPEDRYASTDALVAALSSFY